jgi:hypothetical protein
VQISSRGSVPTPAYASSRRTSSTQTADRDGRLEHAPDRASEVTDTDSERARGYPEVQRLHERAGDGEAGGHADDPPGESDHERDEPGRKRDERIHEERPGPVDCLEDDRVEALKSEQHPDPGEDLHDRLCLGPAIAEDDVDGVGRNHDQGEH